MFMDNILINYTIMSPFLPYVVLIFSHTCLPLSFHYLTKRCFAQNEAPPKIKLQ